MITFKFCYYQFSSFAKFHISSRLDLSRATFLLMAIPRQLSRLWRHDRSQSSKILGWLPFQFQTLETETVMQTIFSFLQLKLYTVRQNDLDQTPVINDCDQLERLPLNNLAHCKTHERQLSTSSHIRRQRCERKSTLR